MELVCSHVPVSSSPTTHEVQDRLVGCAEGYSVNILWMTLYCAAALHALLLVGFPLHAAALSSSSVGGGNQNRVVVIVGAGVGGLATAARLGSQEDTTTVHIVEKNAVPGGRCGSFWHHHQNELYRHERGPSLLLLPKVYEQLFQDVAGMSCSEFGLQIEPCVPAYQAIFEDGDTVQLGFPASAPSSPGDGDDDNLHRMREEAKRTLDRWEENGAAKWDEYLSICQTYLDAGFPNFIEERLELTSLPKFVGVCLRKFGQAWPLQPHSDLLDALFESPKLKALASFQDLYVGLEPYKNKDQPFGGVLTSTAPAVFGLLSAIEFQDGVYAPTGGFAAVTKALERLATSSGSTTIHYESSVTTVQDDGVHYIDHKTNASHFLPADLVIVNADLPYAEKSLLSDSTNSVSTKLKFDWNDDYRFSSGVIAFHWSLDVALRDRLCTHNVFLAASNRTVAEQSWSALRDNTRRTSAPFNFYVHCASRTDPSAAPRDGESILVLVPCETLQRDACCAEIPRDKALQTYSEQFDDVYIDNVRQAVLQRMQTIVSLDASNIIEESVETPASYASDYNLAAGTPFGISHGFGQLSVFRPAPSKILHVGASTRPGNGVPLVLVGARRIAEQAARRLAALRRD